MKDANKESILEAWIMVERLSIGDIDTNDKEVQGFIDLKDGDYYALLKDMIEKKSGRGNSPKGVIVYLGIFEFSEVVERLRHKYGFTDTYEDIRYGKKFKLALSFDAQLNLMEDETFLSESAYILDTGNVPREKDLNTCEEYLKKVMIDKFYETAGGPEKLALRGF